MTQMATMLPLVSMVPEAPQLPDLEEAAFRWSGEQVAEFDRRCAEQAALIAERPYEKAAEQWRDHFRLSGANPDGVRGGQKPWFRDFMADLNLPTHYPKTFLEGRPEREIVRVRGVEVVLTREHDSLEKIVDAIWSAIGPAQSTGAVVVPLRPAAEPLFLRDPIPVSELAADEGYEGVTTHAELYAAERAAREEGRLCGHCDRLLAFSAQECSDCGHRNRRARPTLSDELRARAATRF